VKWIKQGKIHPEDLISYYKPRKRGRGKGERERKNRERERE